MDHQQNENSIPAAQSPVTDSFVLKGNIQRGDLAPWWNQGSYKFAFDAFGGRYIVLNFYRTYRDEIGRESLQVLNDQRTLIGNQNTVFFCVSSDFRDKTQCHVDTRFPQLRFLWDIDGTITRAYGVGSGRMWIVLDPMLRVLEVIPYRRDGSDRLALRALLEGLPAPAGHVGIETVAPVLLLPNVFEPEFCQYLISCYETSGGRESGFMQELQGKTAEVYDSDWKRRKDLYIADPRLIDLIKTRLSRRVGGILQRVFQFQMSRVERFLVACYSAEDAGHFGPHRDDTIKATEHRRFAASINLNTEFDGGELIFPEYGPRAFKPPTGCGLIFSASILHQVTRVMQGRRYVFLPFFHDEQAEKVRLQNLQDLHGGS
ncbi:MAG TPA: 2OG-Fe(II) oxygenase [Bryobacteraceae bacterium]|nr:2OG-Fe(II) oxygenase [Bryobacteraceae bacterium]